MNVTVGFFMLVRHCRDSIDRTSSVSAEPDNLCRCDCSAVMFVAIQLHIVLKAFLNEENPGLASMLDSRSNNGIVAALIE
jgi:hypothetical protein